MDADNDILSHVEIDDDSKSIFLRMPREEQLLAILNMLSYLRNEMALNRKKSIDFDREFKIYKEKQDEYRMLREKEERRVSNLITSFLSGRSIDEQATRPVNQEELMTTTQKIIREVGKAFAARFDFWVWIRDKVLPSIITIIILGLLALIFKDRLP